jgi:two-component system response regulator MprA
MSAHILIADDSKTQVYRLKLDLERAGYLVSCAYDGIETLQYVREQAPDLILLDYRMPKLDGMNVLQRLRSKGFKKPIILMTAHNSDKLHIECLKQGSNDFLTLPIASQVLLAHVEARLKEEQIEPQQSKIEPLKFADIRLDSQEHSAYRGNDVLLLTCKEYDLLELFLKHPRQVLKYGLILERIWGNDSAVESNVVAVTTSNLRIKLEGSGCQLRVIQTIRGVGYILKEPDGA